jgi:hypothetical protein
VVQKQKWDKKVETSRTHTTAEGKNNDSQGKVNVFPFKINDDPKISRSHFVSLSDDILVINEQDMEREEPHIILENHE